MFWLSSGRGDGTSSTRPMRRPAAAIARSSRRRRRRLAPRRSGSHAQALVIGQRSLAISGAVGRDERPVAVRHRGRQGEVLRGASGATSWRRSGSAGPTSWHSGLRGAAHDGKPPAATRAVSQRPGEAERPLLADRARTAAQPAGRSGGRSRARKAASWTASRRHRHRSTATTSRS